MKKWGYYLFAWIYNVFTRFGKIQNKTVFMNGHDYEFNGNLAAMHQKMQKEYPSRRLVVVSKRQLLSGKGKRGHSFFHKIRGCVIFFVCLPWHMATAKQVFLNDNFIPLAYMHTGSRATQFVQLWHGAGAFKKFGLSTESDPEVRRLVTLANRNITHLFVTSGQVIPYYEEAFGIAKDRIHATGVPVTDRYFDAEAVQRSREAFYRQYPALRNKKVLLFAPTFRKKAADNDCILERFSAEKVWQALGDDWVILIKMHPKFSLENIVESKYCYNMTHYHDISDLYLISDVLVTDYSSTVVEYVLLNKPVILFAYDLEQYDRGFYRSYEETAPGDIARSTEELVGLLEQKRDNLVKRQTFVKLQYDNVDGQSIERIMKILEGC